MMRKKARSINAVRLFRRAIKSAARIVRPRPYWGWKWEARSRGQHRPPARPQTVAREARVPAAVRRPVGVSLGRRNGFGLAGGDGVFTWGVMVAWGGAVGARLSWGGGVAESEKSFYRQRWESDFVPWRDGVTNAEGKAVIPIVITALDHTRGREPPPNRDVVSNREYVIKLQGQNKQDEMLVVMKPDEEVSGKRYSIRIDKIEKPIYVPTP